MTYHDAQLYFKLNESLSSEQNIFFMKVNKHP